MSAAKANHTSGRAATMDEFPAVDLSQIQAGSLSITPRFLPVSLLARLRSDASQLHAAGAFTTGGVGGRTERLVRTTTDQQQTRLCDICGLFDDALQVPSHIGEKDAREELFDLMADLRGLLRTTLGRSLGEQLELQYLRYPGDDDAKGHYGRHVDHAASDDAHDIVRSVSLIIYLNDETWDADKDGGLLIAYPRGKPPQQVSPEGGTLVLFDSKTVEHEVLATNRERLAVVGWFMEPGRRRRPRAKSRSRKKQRKK
jgi:hypothetical protein